MEVASYPPRSDDGYETTAPYWRLPTLKRIFRSLHGVKRFADRKGQRYLSQRELVALGQALTDREKHGLNPQALAILKLLVFTGHGRARSKPCDGMLLTSKVNTFD